MGKTPTQPGLCKAATSLVALLALILSVCAPFAPHASATPPVVIAMDDYPPYHFWENGIPMGLNVDIIIEAFQIMDTPVQFLRTPWKRSFHYLKDGTVTALCAGFKTPERETFCIYPHEPLSMETNVIFSVGDTKHAINSLEDLRGLAVGVTAEYSYGPTFDAFEGLDKHILPTDTKLLGMLQHGRLDVAVGNRIVLNHLARELGTANNLKPLYVLNSMPQYLIFSRSLGQKAQEIADRFDQAMSQLHENGTLKRIRSHY